MNLLNKPISRTTLALPWLIMFVGSILTYMVFTHISKIDRDQNYLRDYGEIFQLHDAIGRRFSLVFSEVSALKGFFLSSDTVTDDEWQRFMHTAHRVEIADMVNGVYYFTTLPDLSSKHCKPKFDFEVGTARTAIPCADIITQSTHVTQSKNYVIFHDALNVDPNTLWLLTPLQQGDSNSAPQKILGWFLLKLHAPRLFSPLEETDATSLGIQMITLDRKEQSKNIVFQKIPNIKISNSITDFLYFHASQKRRLPNQKNHGFASNKGKGTTDLNNVVGVRNIRYYPQDKKVTYLNQNVIVLEAQMGTGHNVSIIKLWRAISTSNFAYLVTATCFLITAFIASLVWFQLRIRVRAESLSRAMTSELKQNEGRLRAALEGSNDGIWDHDVSAGTIWYSPRWYAMLGYSDRDLPSTTAAMRSLLHPDDAPWVLDSIHQHLADGKAYDIQCRMRHKSGDYRWIRTRGFVKKENGEVIRVAGINADVTEEREYKATLEAAKKTAENASRAKAEFVANMSHEIRTPLNGIIGVAELLQGTELSIKQQQYINILQSSSLSLYEIVNEVLDFSKIEAGQIKIELLGFNMVQTATEAVEIAKQYARIKNNVEVIMRVAPNLPSRFVSDPTRIRQCLLNLLSNAVKFTHHGHVLLNIDGEQKEDGQYLLTISVEDTGIGISPDNLDAVFKQFTQADSSTTREYGGTGLGLAIVKTMVEMLGGTIHVQSTLGKGSRFEMQIPMPVDDQAQTFVNIQDLSTISGLRILVVDSNPTNLNILEEMLEYAGLKPVLADSAVTAMAIFQSAENELVPFDFALIDYNISGMNGEALLEEIRKQHPSTRTRFLLTASSLQRGDGERMQQLGFRGYLQKPLSRDLLISSILAVQKLLAQGDENVFVTRHTINEASRNQSSPASLTQERFSMRILVVEDNLTNQQVLGWVLEDAGFTYVVVSNGQEALEILTSDANFQCILMDCQMPVMDGFDATRAIRALDSTTRSIAIYALTANASKEDETRALEAGMDAFLTKPVDPQKLKKLLTQLAQNLLTKHSDEADDSASPLAQSTVIDAARIHDITAGNLERMQRFITLFSSTFTNEKDGLIAALHAEDEALATRHAHTLKGASANLYALQIQSISQNIELAIKAANHKEALALAATLDGAYKTFFAAYQQLMGDAATKA